MALCELDLNQYLPFQLTAAAFTLQYWDKNGSVNIAVWISIFAILVILVNLFGSLGVSGQNLRASVHQTDALPCILQFAEEEFWSSCLKLLVIFIFLFSALVFVLGGGPSSGEYSSYVQYGGLSPRMEADKRSSPYLDMLEVASTTIPAHSQMGSKVYAVSSSQLPSHSPVPSLLVLLPPNIL